MASRQTDQLFEILGHLKQAHLLAQDFQARNYQNDLVDDVVNLTDDALAQIGGAIRDYQEGRAA